MERGRCDGTLDGSKRPYRIVTPGFCNGVGCWMMVLSYFGMCARGFHSFVLHLYFSNSFDIQIHAKTVIVVRMAEANDFEVPRTCDKAFVRIY